MKKYIKPTAEAIKAECEQILAGSVPTEGLSQPNDNVGQVETGFEGGYVKQDIMLIFDELEELELELGLL